MTNPTRGEVNNNPGNIERIANNKWQGQLSDTAYKQTREYREKGGRFDVFSSVEWGVRALASLLTTYQDRHGLRTIRAIIGRWAPGHENDTAAYVAHVSKLTGFPADAILQLHGYDHIAPLVKAIITHENGRNLYADSVIDDGLFRAGVKGPDSKVVSAKSDAKKTKIAVAGVGTAGVLGTVGIINQVTPAVTPVLQAIGGLPWWLGLTVVVLAVAGGIAWWKWVRS